MASQKLYNTQRKINQAWKTMDQDDRPTVSLGQLAGIASKADAVLTKTIDATVKSIERNPSLENIQNGINKLTSINEDAILPETDNYFKVMIEDLTNFKNFREGKTKQSVGLNESIRKLESSDRNIVNSIRESIDSQETSGYLSRKEGTLARAELDNKLKEIDIAEDAESLKKYIPLLTASKSYKEGVKHIGDEFLESQNTGNRAFLFNVLRDMHSTATAKTNANQRLKREGVLNNQQETYNKIEGLVTDLGAVMNTFDQNDLSSQLKLTWGMNKPSHSQRYGSDSADDIGQYQIGRVLNDRLKDVQDIIERDINPVVGVFWAKNIKNTKLLFEQYKEEFLNPIHPDHRMRANEIMESLLLAYKPDQKDSDGKHGWYAVIQKQKEILDTIYDYAPRDYPNIFGGIIDNAGNPKWGSGIIPIDKSNTQSGTDYLNIKRYRN